MNGTKLFVDTNIILYWMNGDKTLAELLHQKQIYLSFITELELLGYKQLSESEKLSIQELLANCYIVDVNPKIKSLVVHLRKTSSLKLPDCIILASALYLDIPLVTSDSDFKKVEDIDLLFYEQ